MADKGRRETFELGNDDREKGNRKERDSNDKLLQEVEKLLKKGGLSPIDIQELHKRYPDDERFVDEILRATGKRYKKVKKQAKKLAQKIYDKYNQGNRPMHEILEKMMKFKNDYKWSDQEYDEFRKELSALLTGRRAEEIDYNQNLYNFRSRINRALGYNNMMFSTENSGLRVKENEQGVLSEIFGMYEKSNALYKSVFMQSLMYEDFSLLATTGEYDRKKHVASNYIHPVIACMFLPKFDIFESQMLYSNFGTIIKNRYEKKPIVTEPDAMLYYSMISDPNDVVCDPNSPITDIKNRYRVQLSLWETVLKLRSGNYYEANPTGEFLAALNTCRNNLYDNADLAYNQDEGSIMRRLLSVFSLRPTIIATRPIYTITSFAANPFANALNYGMDMGDQYPFNAQPTPTITQIPMITVQIPPMPVLGNESEIQPKDLRASTIQTIWINEKKTIVPKEQSIIFSNEVLIFYVNRRIQRVQIKSFANPLTFSQLPLAMSSFEKLNNYPVNVPDRITLRSAEDTYLLRSVVAVNETRIKQGPNVSSIITGSTGLIMSHRNFERNIFESKYYLYDPFGASLPVYYRNPDSNEDGFFTNKPISTIEPYFSTPSDAVANGAPENLSFFDRAKHNGTIFIYAKPTGYTTSQIIL